MDIIRKRISLFKEVLSSKGLDGYIVTNKKSHSYFTGYSGGEQLLIMKESDNIYYVNGVNYEAAKKETQYAEIELISHEDSLIKKLVEEIKRKKLKNIGFDSLDSSSYLVLNKSLKKTTLSHMNELVWTLRSIKDEYEIALIRKAANLTDLGMEKAVNSLSDGISENEIVAEVEYKMRKSGSDGVAFNTIVSSGENSAFPHGGSKNRTVKEGDFIMIDIGAIYYGYCADISRTIIIGRPTEKQKKVYNIVKEAQVMAIEGLNHGIKASEIDSLAREYISKKNYGSFFVHNLGHGVGLEIHEPPTLGPMSKDTLKFGNVITIEPGIYVPNFGGVRIEDTIVINCEIEILTKALIPEY